ncbi:MAG TPA: hypothetical protein VMT51_08860 [Dongiaceae bacterium]|nr:hypothetical protein [Dongiaceae bacterium]
MSSLLSPPSEPSNKPKAIVYAAAGILVALLIVGYFLFRYYPEKKATEHFLNALVAGDTKKAYQLWKPSESYRFGDFLADWGPEGYYGPVKSYEIVKAESKRGANGVIISVRVSRFAPMPDKADLEKSRWTKQVSVWVKSADKSLSFPPSF